MVLRRLTEDILVFGGSSGLLSISFKSYLAVGLLAGSILRHMSMIFDNL